MSKVYESWRAVTEADFVSLFIKTWFAYISTLREKFPEAHNRRGDKKYLNAYKEFYKKSGSKAFIVDDQIMAAINRLYKEGRKIIIASYPEYFFWDFYRINEEFQYAYKEIPPDKKGCLVFGFRLARKRSAVHSFELNGYAHFWGDFHANQYEENIQFSCDISATLESLIDFLKDNKQISEQEYLSHVLDELKNCLINELTVSMNKMISDKTPGKWLLAKYSAIHMQCVALIQSISLLNIKDESLKTTDEMTIARNTYEIVCQRPRNCPNDRGI